MTLGNKIQELRKRQSLSQEAFADILGVTRQSVSKWELDQSYPAIDKLVEMADFFNVSLDEMLRNETTNSSSFTTNNAQDINDIHDINNVQDINNDEVNHKNNNSKNYLTYFLWWAIMAIIIMILFGIKEYFAGFIVSQILVWTTVIIKIYSYIKSKINHVA